jgi:hypothetical protein
MSRRKGRITMVRKPADGGVEPNRYLPETSVEIRVFAPPKTPLWQVADTITEAYYQALAEASEDYARTAKEGWVIP